MLAGLEPPKLEEIGPYVMHKSKEKKSNVTFFDNNTKVRYVATNFNEWQGTPLQLALPAQQAKYHFLIISST